MWLVVKGRGPISGTDTSCRLGRWCPTDIDIDTEETDSKETDSEETDSKEADSNEVDSKDIDDEDLNTQLDQR